MSEEGVFDGHLEGGLWVAGTVIVAVLNPEKLNNKPRRLLLVWLNLAMGLIGNEDNPTKLMYVGVVAVGLIAVFLIRPLRPI